MVLDAAGWFGCGLISIGLCWLFLMLLLDSKCGRGIESLLLILRIRSKHGLRITASELFEQNRSRLIMIVVLVGLVCVGITMSLVVCLLSFDPNLLIALGGMVGVVVSFVIWWEQLAFYGFVVRLKCRSEQLSDMCSAALRDWPNIGDCISTVGARLMPTNDAVTPDCLAIEDTPAVGASCADQFGPVIRRYGDSIILDSATDFNYMLVYNKDGCVPDEFRDCFEYLHVLFRQTNARRLRHDLFLVAYAPSPR